MNRSQQGLLNRFSAASAFPIVPPLMESQLLAVLYQLEQSQWWSAEQLQESQFEQLALLCAHAEKEIPFYRLRFREAGLDPRRLTLEAWQRLPVLTRLDLQGREASLSTANLPAPYQVAGKIATSGSTGHPVVISTTNLTQFLWNVFTLREHQWHGLDFSKKLSAIRYVEPGGNLRADYPRGISIPHWGPPATLLYRTGPSSMLNITTTTIAQQWEWLLRENPDYLVTYPTALAELIRLSEAEDQRPSALREVRLLGETVDDSLRTACQRGWNVPVVDTYSANEVGAIAHQCPEHPHYHVQSENVFVEILNEQNQSCAPGEIGRVVVTALHNFATPLIRYFIGDYAEVGSKCSCGRGLPVLTRILGRVRNILTLPTGEKRWPMPGWERLGRIAPISQHQLIQRSLHRIEARFVVHTEVGPEQERQMTAAIQEAFGYPFEVIFSYPDVIERSPSGKFEEFKSDLV